jgi:hypothetical protein
MPYNLSRALQDLKPEKANSLFAHIYRFWMIDGLDAEA